MMRWVREEPVRCYAVLLALWTVVTAVWASVDGEIPPAVDVAVQGLLAALMGTDLRGRVTPWQPPGG